MATAATPVLSHRRTFTYDPYGNPTANAVPDNATGDFDFAWVGSARRFCEHDTGVLSQIEMGARLYDPGLGRFLVDPVEGGSANDYDYAGDPVNGSDPEGLWCAIHNSQGRCKGAGLLRQSRSLLHSSGSSREARQRSLRPDFGGLLA